MVNKYKCRKTERYVWGYEEIDAIDKLWCRRCLMGRGECEGPVLFYIKKEGNDSGNY